LRVAGRPLPKNSPTLLFPLLFKLVEEGIDVGFSVEGDFASCRTTAAEKLTNSPLLFELVEEGIGVGFGVEGDFAGCWTTAPENSLTVLFIHTRTYLALLRSSIWEALKMESRSLTPRQIS